MQSGRPDRSVTLGSDLNERIEAFENTPGGARYLDLTSDAGRGEIITTRYDRHTKRIVIDSVAVEGGWIELTGQIMNTNPSASLRVMDGYGQISVTNNTSHAVFLNRIDTGGEGIEGRIIIRDTVGTYHQDTLYRYYDGDGNLQRELCSRDMDGRIFASTDETLRAQYTRLVVHRAGDPIPDARPKVTIYTRVGSDIQVTVDGVLDSTHAATRTLGGASGYQPAQGQRFVHVQGQEFATYIFKEYIRSEFWGADWLAKDLGRLPDKTWTVAAGAPVPLPTGSFVEWRSDLGGTHSVTTSGIKFVLQDETFLYSYTYTTSRGWWIFSIQDYHLVQVFMQGGKEFSNVSTKADYPIAIDFIGYDQGDILVSSATDVIVGGALVNGAGRTYMVSGGSIRGTTAALVGGNRIDLVGFAGIGESGLALRTELHGGGFSAQSFTGDIVIDARDSGLNVVKVWTGDGDVRLSADFDITALDSDSLVSGGSIELTSRYGGIGGASRPLRMDSGDGDTVTVSAVGDIRLAEIAGDLRLVSLGSVGGDVDLTVENGNLLDANANDIRDERTIAELEALWANMRLTIATGADEAALESIRAYEGLKTREYDSYWTYREQQPDSSTYDATFSVSLSDLELEYYQSIGWTAADISDLEAKRTQEYHDLHAEYGRLGDLRMAGFSYAVTAGSDEYDRLMSGHAWTEAELALTFNPSLLRAKTDTEAKIEEANIAGRNVRVSTPGGGLGAIGGSCSFSLPMDTASLTSDQRVMLAAAERDDMIFRDVSGNVTDLYAVGDRTPVTLEIRLHDDIDVQASGGVTIAAMTHVYLGSEQDINIDTVTGGDVIRIKGGRGIYDVGAEGDVTGADIVLEAADSALGSADRPIDVTLLRGTLTARATGDIFLAAGPGRDLYVDGIYSESGQVTVTAQGSIFDGNGEDVWNIRAEAVTLTATGGSIGSAVNPLMTELPLADAGLPGRGLTTLTAAADIFVRELSGDMNVGLVHAGGTASLAAAVSILDANDTPNPNVVADRIILLANLGGIGAAGNDLDIDSSFGSAGTVTITSSQNVYLIEVLGDLLLEQVLVTSPGRKAYIAAQGGILNANTAGDAAVIAGAAIFRSEEGVGENGNTLVTRVQSMEGEVLGGMWVHNMGALSVGNAGDGTGGTTTAGGGIEITASSPVTGVADVAR